MYFLLIPLSFLGCFICLFLFIRLLSLGSSLTSINTIYAVHFCVTALSTPVKVILCFLSLQTFQAFQFHHLYAIGVAASLKRNDPLNLVSDEILENSCSRYLKTVSMGPVMLFLIPHWVYFFLIFFYLMI